MEVLRINGQAPTVSFSGLVPSAVYTLSYTDLVSELEFSDEATAATSGQVTFTLDDRYAKYDGILDAIVTNYLDEEVVTTNIDVVRPYISDLSGLSTSLNKSLSAVKDMERTARYIIDSEVSQGFGFVRKEKEVVGNGSDFLVINEKINKLYKVYENGVLLYDSESNNNEVTFAISKDKTSVVPVESQQNKTEYPEVWRDRYLGRTFADGYDYIIDADYGYRVIPQDIQEAAELLCSDLSSGNMKYLNKYIESFDNEDFKIKFAKNFNASTGNMIVDRILTKYKNDIRVGVL
jgi:hypothetical protein